MIEKASQKAGQRAGQRSGQKVKVVTVEQAIEKLKVVPDKPKEELTLRESIEMMRPVIKQVLDKGYSYDEVAIMLAETGIQIGGATIKQYMATKPSRSGKSRGSSHTPKNEESANVDSKAVSDEKAKESKAKESEIVQSVEEISKPEKKRSSKNAEEEFSSY